MKEYDNANVVPKTVTCNKCSDYYLRSSDEKCVKIVATTKDSDCGSGKVV